QSGNGSEEYVETWETEVIQIFVDDSGVFSFNWLSPTVLGDKTNESVELLDFSQIKTIILDNLKYVYSLPPYVEHIEKQALKIDKIEFAYAKCPVINSDEFQLVPCWNVYGNIKTYYANDLQDPNWDEENTETQSVPMGVLLKINAIDGSLI
ncbi:MAG: DUF6034 family protein, partial [Christensenellaceae bacterium]